MTGSATVTSPTVEIEPVATLDAAALQAIAALERDVVAHDGGRLKLEWSSLRRRDGTGSRDLLARDGGRLVGYLGLYAFGGPTVELAGMVAPARRRGGIGSALLDAALALCASQGHTRALLIVARATPGGAELARGRGGRLEHSEHALVLDGDPVAPGTGATAEPAAGSDRAAVALHPARRADVSRVIALLTDGFGWAPPDLATRLHDDHLTTLVVRRDDEVLAMVRIARDGDEGSVYGFVVAAPLRGRGLGRAVLVAACRRLRADGARRIALEVASDNDAALGLYESVGFARLATEDYYELDL